MYIRLHYTTFTNVSRIQILLCSLDAVAGVDLLDLSDVSDTGTISEVKRKLSWLPCSDMKTIVSNKLKLLGTCAL